MAGRILGALCMTEHMHECQPLVGIVREALQGRQPLPA